MQWSDQKEKMLRILINAGSVIMIIDTDVKVRDHCNMKNLDKVYGKKYLENIEALDTEKLLY